LMISNHINALELLGFIGHLANGFMFNSLLNQALTDQQRFF
jgi:hypothetical protein